MCTVSIITIPGSPGAYRLVTNRDEQRSRPIGEPPAWRSLRGVRALAPIDPASGGTWVATNESGLTLCLLNGNLEPSLPPPAEARSRGLLIPGLIGCRSIDGVLGALATTPLGPYPPFRLVIVEPGSASCAEPRVADAFWDGRILVQNESRAVPACFVSSGLGDSRALPRLPLFATTVALNATAQEQDAFHRHVWPDRPEISVCMSRADARTVSITTLWVEPAAGALPRVQAEHAQVPDTPASAVSSSSPDSTALATGRGTG
jgi:hypothetical protein